MHVSVVQAPESEAPESEGVVREVYGIIGKRKQLATTINSSYWTLLECWYGANQTTRLVCR